MEKFARKNQTPLTTAIVLIAALTMIIDWWLEKQTSTTVQWWAFIIAVILLIYVNFVATADVIEYEEEYYPHEKGEHSVPSLQDKQVEELTKQIEHHEDAWKEAGIAVHDNLKVEYSDKDPKAKVDSKTRTVYVVQPIHVTEEELQKTINNNQIDMETEKPKNELPKALEDPQIVTGYSLHNINKKYRSMYGDICQFATTGERKTKEDLIAKVKLYGFPYTVDLKSNITIAFDMQCEPKVRIPESGYFGIK